MIPFSLIDYYKRKIFHSRATLKESCVANLLSINLEANCLFRFIIYSHVPYFIIILYCVIRIVSSIFSVYPVRAFKGVAIFLCIEHYYYGSLFRVSFWQQAINAFFLYKLFCTVSPPNSLKYIHLIQAYNTFTHL